MTTPAPIINNNVSQTDLMYFKEEILGNIKQMENKVNDKINQMTKLVDTKLSPYQSKFDEISSITFGDIKEAKIITTNLEENSRYKQETEIVEVES